MKINAFFGELELHASRTRIGISDTFQRNRVRTQIAGHHTSVGNRRGALQALHKDAHRRRVELGSDQILITNAISLALVFARKIQIVLDGRGLRPKQHRLSSVAFAFRARKHRAGEARDAHPCVLALIVHHARIVLLCDVRHFMRKHAGELTFGLRQKHQSHVHADITTRHGKRIDATVGHCEKLEWFANRRVGSQHPLPQFVQIRVDLRILQIRAAGSQLAHAFCAHFSFLLARHQCARAVAQFGQQGLGTRDGGSCAQHHAR